MVDLTKTKKSSKFRDETWIPEEWKEWIIDPTYKGEDGSIGKILRRPADSSGSIITNPDGFGELDYHERGMLESGATLNEIMFMRALERYKQKGWKPAVNKR